MKLRAKLFLLQLFSYFVPGFLTDSECRKWVKNQNPTFWCRKRGESLFQVEIHDSSANLDPQLPMVLIIHGWTNCVGKQWETDLMNAYLNFQDANICAMDWSYLANQGYLDVILHNLQPAKNAVVEFTQFLNEIGFKNGDITFVGHSLGAHISGYAGAALGGSIGNIYGLDPAGPGFCQLSSDSPENRLNPSNAQYVQVIITTSQIGCNDEGLGHQTFVINSPFNAQPQCGILDFVCSHMYAITFFIWSLNPDNNYAGQKCFSYSAFTFKKCRYEPTDLFGPRHLLNEGTFYTEIS